MDIKLKEQLSSFFEKSLTDHFKTLTLEELKCIDWLVLDADLFIDEKNKKVA